MKEFHENYALHGMTFIVDPMLHCCCAQWLPLLSVGVVFISIIIIISGLVFKGNKIRASRSESE